MCRSESSMKTAPSISLTVAPSSCAPPTSTRSLSTTLLRLVAKTNPAYRVNNVQTEQELADNQTIRERLLASLALFFTTVALLLAASAFTVF
jgi:hypothetical protein